MNDLLTVEIVACRRQFSGPEADAAFVDLSFAFHMDCMRVNGHRSRPIIPNQGRVRDPLKEQRQTALTPQVASEHEVQNEETVVVVLERIAHVHDERVVDLVRVNRITGNPRQPEAKTVSCMKSGTEIRMTDLFKQPPLLNDVGDRSLFGTLPLVNVLQCEQLL